MNKTFLLLAFAILFSCNKDGRNSKKTVIDSVKIIDSINMVRTKHNDSIKILSTKNLMRDLSGKHKFTHNSITRDGSVDFKNIGRDLYEISGSAKSGNDYVKIEGELKMVSEEYLNFTGKITQSIAENDNGKVDVRTKKTSFAKKGNDKYWRLQNRLNSFGFVDYIDIY